MFIPAVALPSHQSGLPVDPQAATLLDRDGWFYDWLLDGQQTASGQRVTESSSLHVSAVFACVRNIAEDIGKLPLPVYRRMKRGKERVPKHPLYHLLHDAPNPEMDSMSWRQAGMVDILLGGNTYSEIARTNDGEVVELWPIQRDRVRPKRYRGENGEIYYEIIMPEGGMDYLPESNMFHVRGIGDPWIGWSIIKLARESIGGAQAAEKFGNGYFGEGAVPSGVLEHPGSMKPEAAKRMAESWEKRHSGKRRVAVLEEGMKYHPLSMSNADSQFLESRMFAVEEICRWFRMPPHKVMHLERSTFSNIEEQNIEYVTDCLTSHAKRWEQEIARKLIPKRQPELFAEILFDGLLRGDSLKRAQVMKEKIYSGQLSPNDAREIDGMNPVDGGDSYFIPSTMTTLELAAEGPQAQPPPQAPKPTPPEEDAEPAQNRKSRRESLISAHIDVLADAVGRLLKIEAHHIGKYAKPGKPTTGEAIAKFYREYDDIVAATLPAPIEAFGLSYWMAWSAEDPAAVARLIVADHIKAASARHVGLLRSEMANESSLERWSNGTRAGSFARGELEQLADRLDGLLTQLRPEYLNGTAA